MVTSTLTNMPNTATMSTHLGRSIRRWPAPGSSGSGAPSTAPRSQAAAVGGARRGRPARRGRFARLTFAGVRERCGGPPSGRCRRAAPSAADRGRRGDAAACARSPCPARRGLGRRRCRRGRAASGPSLLAAAGAAAGTVGMPPVASRPGTVPVGFGKPATWPLPSPAPRSAVPPRSGTARRDDPDVGRAQHVTPAPASRAHRPRRPESSTNTWGGIRRRASLACLNTPLQEYCFRSRGRSLHPGDSGSWSVRTDTAATFLCER